MPYCSYSHLFSKEKSFLKQNNENLPIGEVHNVWQIDLVFAGLDHYCSVGTAFLWSGINRRSRWPPCGQQAIVCWWTRMAFVYAHRVFSKGPCYRPSRQQCSKVSALSQVPSRPEAGLFCMEYFLSYGKKVFINNRCYAFKRIILVDEIEICVTWIIWVLIAKIDLNSYNHFLDKNSYCKRF